MQSAHLLIGAGLTLVPSYSLLSTEVIFQKLCHFQILQSEKIPEERNAVAPQY